MTVFADSGRPGKKKKTADVKAPSGSLLSVAVLKTASDKPNNCAAVNTFALS